MGNVDCIFTGDIHFSDKNPRCRTDNYLEALIDKMRFVFEYSEKAQCAIMDVGDLLNKYSVNSHLERIIYSLFKGYTTTFNTIYGNHDMPFHSFKRRNEGSLGLLHTVGALNVIEDVKVKAYGTTVVNYYAGHYKHGFDLPEKRVGERNVLLLHEMISTDARKFTTHNAQKMIDTFGVHYDLIVTGHNHQHFTVSTDDCTLVNVGSLMRSKAHQIDYKPVVIGWNASTNEIIEIPVPITENVIDINYLIKEKKRNKTMESFVEVIKNKKGITYKFDENVRNYCKTNDISQMICDRLEKYINE
jgi:predicted phosphodiesterase